MNKDSSEKKMGNTIIPGAITGVVIYISDILISPYTSTSDLMYLFKFVIQGMVVTAFVKGMIHYSVKQNYLSSRDE